MGRIFLLPAMKRFLLQLAFVLLCCMTAKSVSAQIITTIAGNFFSGSHYGDGGLAINAGIDHPFGVAVDSKGNVYLSEYSWYVRKIDHKGIITTYEGGYFPPAPLGDGGPATDAYLDKITDLAIDAADNLYIVDHSHSRIRRVDKAGIITS